MADSVHDGDPMPHIVPDRGEAGSLAPALGDPFSILASPVATRAGQAAAGTSSVHTLKLASVLGPKVLLIATSDA
jgi:hypothetical protein